MTDPAAPRRGRPPPPRLRGRPRRVPRPLGRGRPPRRASGSPRRSGSCPSVVVPEPVLTALCTRCAREGADGLRADLTIYKAASALAAYEGRTTVTARRRRRRRRAGAGAPPDDAARPDTAAAPARLRLPRTRTARRPSGPRLRRGREYYAGRDRPSEPRVRGTERGPPAPRPTRTTSRVDPGGRAPRRAAVDASRSRPARPATAGRRGEARGDRSPRRLRAARRFPGAAARDPALVATLRAAAPWQAARGRREGGGADRPRRPTSATRSGHGPRST